MESNYRALSKGGGTVILIRYGISCARRDDLEVNFERK